MSERSITTDASSESAFLRGLFAPVDEERTLTELTVRGTLPDYLDGRYLRNGSNPIGAVDPTSYNWFLGAGMVHGLRLADGEARWYRNRWVRAAAVTRALGEPPPTGRWKGGFDFAANTNVIGHAGRTLAVVEAGASPYELTDELDTVGRCDFHGTLDGAFSAHPTRDPVTGELHTVSYNPMWGNRLRYTVAGTDGRVRRTVPITVTGQPMVHDFSLTESHVVIYDLPVTMDLSARPGALGAMARAWGTRAVPGLVQRLIAKGSATGRVSTSDLNLPYRWNPDYPARVGVMPRDGGDEDVRWFDVEPCYVFHPMNAYDDGTTIVIDLVRHHRMFETGRIEAEDNTPTLDRWTIDLERGTVRESRTDDRAQEFPRVDERRVGRRHRYGYSVGVGADELQGTGLFRHDLDGGTTLNRTFHDGWGVGEFVHVAPDGADEGDGVVMGFIHDRTADRSELAILDAATLEDVAAVELPVRIPLGFHGNWVPTADNP